MAPEQDKKRTGRKLVKKRKMQRATSLQYPERLQFRKGEDVLEDVTASKGQSPQHLNQSVFSMIAAAGSKVDFHARFEEGSSDSDEGEDLSGLNRNGAKDSSQEYAGTESDRVTVSRLVGQQHGELSAERAGRSLPKLNLQTIKENNHKPQSSRLQPDEPVSSVSSPSSMTPRDAPVMSMMIQAQAQLVSSSTKAYPQIEDLSTSGGRANPSSLAIRLKEIFGFEEPEEVISEYPCWLLQSVLLQGYMYITLNHICFYAYLPKKSNIVAKTGYLSKRGKQNPKFNRYWFSLQGDVLSYYVDPSTLYFPSGNIDLRYCISASLVDSKDKGKEALNFTVVTHQREYYFKADSAASAKEWVKTLQKVIFRSHNDGDSVKISLPIENIYEVEESPVIDFAETLKIRVVDSDETYAIDEYFFSFFSFGKDALEVLRSVVDDTTAQKIPTEYLSPSCRGEDLPSTRDSSPGLQGLQGPHGPQGENLRETYNERVPTLHEGVRATLLPVSPHGSGQASPRLSGDWSRNSADLSRKSLDLSQELGRSSFGNGKRSVSTSRMSFTRKSSGGKPNAKRQGSSDSFVHSMEPGTESSMANFSSNNTQASGSQILNRSDVFHTPTIHFYERSTSRSNEENRSRSEEMTRKDSIPVGFRVHPPVRSKTYQNASTDGKILSEYAGSSEQLQHSSSSPTLQQIVKAGAYPLQRAAGFAGYLRTRSKRMSNLLAAESMGYVEKVSGMWTGGRKHYGEGEVVMGDKGMDGVEDEDNAGGYGDRFRAHFALPASEKLQATYFGYLHRVLPLYGKIYISDRKFCFRSLIPGTRTKMILPLKDIENVDKEKGFRFGYSGLVVVIRGHEELFFEFRQSEIRDDCAVTLHENLESIRYLQESGLLTHEDKIDIEIAKAEHRMLQEARQDGHNQHDLRLSTSIPQNEDINSAPPVLFDDPRASILNFKPTEPLRITCLTIGSRGDVQPYIALCKGLLAEGHRAKIATHAEFEPWIRKHGIDFAEVDGDPAELMRICVENGMFTYSFLKEASSKFRGWIDDLLSSAWKACQDTDILIESPSAMAGIHIAEALGIPYFRAFTMPWTRTRAYPHAFVVPEHKLGGAYNYITYVMFDNVFWKAIAGQVNRWRKKELGLRSTSLEKMQPNKVPFLYNFSPSVVVPPLDYSDWIRVTGYWFLDEAADWTPPKALTDFIEKARTGGKKIVYIGFGSIVVSDPAALTRTVIESVLKADVRCILSKGWSDRLGNQDATIPEVPLPSEILQIKSAPHDWLFKQIDAAAHHGGAGTTGASLRVGIPTIVKPFFGDQFFFGSRLEDLGVGICMKKLNVSVFSRALWEATHSERMIKRAKVLGEQIRKETGVANAIQAIYRDLEYAKTLIKNRAATADNEHGGDEESWTFIGDESDPELVRRLAECDSTVHMSYGDTLSRALGSDGIGRLNLVEKEG